MGHGGQGLPQGIAFFHQRQWDRHSLLWEGPKDYSMASQLCGLLSYGSTNLWACSTRWRAAGYLHIALFSISKTAPAAHMRCRYLYAYDAAAEQTPAFLPCLRCLPPFAYLRCRLFSCRAAMYTTYLPPAAHHAYLDTLTTHYRHQAHYLRTIFGLHSPVTIPAFYTARRQLCGNLLRGCTLPCVA